jgi:hypothetical protein
MPYAVLHACNTTYNNHKTAPQTHANHHAEVRKIVKYTELSPLPATKATKVTQDVIQEQTLMQA